MMAHWNLYVASIEMGIGVSEARRYLQRGTLPQVIKIQTIGKIVFAKLTKPFKYCLKR